MLRWLFVLSLTLLASGCGEMSPHSRADTLNVTLAAYANALRWGDFEQALKYVDADYLKAHPLHELDTERYRQVRVVSYTERPVVPVGKDEVEQIVDIGLLNNNTQTERNIVDRQRWHYDEKTKHWHNVSGLPDITQH
jgi:hypothetical protein